MTRPHTCGTCQRIEIASREGHHKHSRQESGSWQIGGSNHASIHIAFEHSDIVKIQTLVTEPLQLIYSKASNQIKVYYIKCSSYGYDVRAEAR